MKTGRRTVPAWGSDGDEAPPRSYAYYPRYEWPPSQRCEAQNRSGERCRKFALRMGRFCKWHARNPHHRANLRKDAVMVQDLRAMARDAKMALDAARQDLQYAAPVAVRELVRLVEDPDTAPSVRARVAEVLLKHSGASLERVQVNLDATVAAVDRDAERKAAIERVHEQLDRLREAALPAPPDEGAVDASHA